MGDGSGQGGDWRRGVVDTASAHTQGRSLTHCPSPPRSSSFTELTLEAIIKNHIFK